MSRYETRQTRSLVDSGREFQTGEAAHWEGAITVVGRRVGGTTVCTGYEEGGFVLQ